MKRISLLFFVALSVLIAFPVFAGPSMEIVELHPEDYNGQTIVFANAWIQGDVDRIVNANDEVYALKYITSENGNLIITTSYLSTNRLDFIVSRKIADMITLANLDPDYKYNCDITVTIGQVNNTSGNLCWVAGISKIDFGEPTGEVFEDDAPFPFTPTSYSYYIPRLATSETEWTGLAMTNLGDSEANITSTIYNAEGLIIETNNTTLNKNGQSAVLAGSDSDTRGWIKVESNQKLAGLAFLATESPNSFMADVPFTDTLSQKYIVPHIAQDQQWDSYVFFCNPNDSAIIVFFDFYSPDGTLLYQKISEPINANGSAKFLVSDIVEGTDQHKGSLVVETLSGGIATFAIYTNVDKGNGGTYYAGINAIPMD